MENLLKDRIYIIDIKGIAKDNFSEMKDLIPMYQTQLFISVAMALQMPIRYRSVLFKKSKHITLVHKNELKNYEEIKYIGGVLFQLLNRQNPEQHNIIKRERKFKEDALNFISRLKGKDLKIKGLKGLLHYIEWKLNIHKDKIEPHIFEDVKLELLEKLKQYKEAEQPEKQKEGNNQKSTDLPYKIALLNEIGFFDLPLMKSLPGTKKREVISKLIGGTDRQIKGNINVLNPRSTDSRTRYTSFAYEDEVKKFISNLFDN
ncbi:MAG: hypothetical protein ACQEWD_00720 [Bacteroidota bacterium]